jgi:hypothetical protein
VCLSGYNFSDLDSNPPLEGCGANFSDRNEKSTIQCICIIILLFLQHSVLIC